MGECTSCGTYVKGNDRDCPDCKKKEKDIRCMCWVMPEICPVHNKNGMKQDIQTTR